MGWLFGAAKTHNSLTPSTTTTDTDRRHHYRRRQMTPPSAFKAVPAQQRPSFPVQKQSGLCLHASSPGLLSHAGCAL